MFMWFLAVGKNQRDDEYLRLCEIRPEDLRQCIGATAYNESGEKLGRVVRIRASRKTGRAVSVEVDTNGKLTTFKADRVIVKLPIETTVRVEGQLAVAKLVKIAEEVKELLWGELKLEKMYISGEIKIEDYLSYKNMYRDHVTDLLKAGLALVPEVKQVNVNHEKEKVREAISTILVTAALRL